MRRIALHLVIGIFFLLAATPVVFAQTDAGSTPQSKSFFEMFFLPDDPLGIAIVWFLLLMSVVNFGYSMTLLAKFRKANMTPELTYTELELMLDDKKYRDAIDFASNDPSYLGKLVDAGLNEASNGYAAMERAIEEAADAETSRMLRPVEYLNVIGNISPMLGLFGTVYGMIVAFTKLVEAGGKPDPAKLAGGISTALVTTFWGLVVAMPALTFYAIVRNKIDALTAEGMIMAEELIRPFKPGGKKQDPAKPGPGKPGGSGPGGSGPSGRPTPKPAPSRK